MYLTASLACKYYGLSNIELNEYARYGIVKRVKTIQGIYVYPIDDIVYKRYLLDEVSIQNYGQPIKCINNAVDKEFKRHQAIVTNHLNKKTTKMEGIALLSKTAQVMSKCY